MWTFTTGTVTSVGTNNVNSAMAVVQEAANYWGRYIDFGGAVLDITVNFISLGDTTLAQAGTSFTSFGGSPFQADTILELQTGIDRNGSSADIDIDINVDTINANQYFYGLLSNPNVPNNQFDLFSVLLHEIGHGLGFLSFDDKPETAVFDTFMSGFQFTGPLAVASFGGQVPLDPTGPSHVAPGLSNFVMTSTGAPGERTFFNETELRILEDIGLPVLGPTAGADVLFGFASADTISLDAGNDHFTALAGNDSVMGGDGNDTVFGGAGNDTIDGGNDADDLRGDAGNDVISGGAGNDSLRGFDGDDVISGGAGIDLIFGHAGNDTADYRTSSAAVAINLQMDTQSGGDAQGDRLFTIENIIGSTFGDTLTGDAGANVIEGEAGNDTILGRAGDDTLTGGAGADRFDFSDGDGDDVITDFGSGGSDLLHFEGYDSLFASASDVLATATQVGADVVFNLNGTDSVRLLNVALNTITVGDIEYIAPLTTSGDDVVNGTGSADFFNGLGGDDVINGLGGNDTLFGGSGEDTIDGGAGVDDVRGDAGNDQLSGGAGNDSLRGFDGNDILSGGAGIDLIFGHAGNDTVDYRTSAAAVAINLQMDTQSGGDAQGDRLFTIENIIGSAFNDTLTGDAGANVIEGETGNDTILGGAGDDTLTGGAGADRFDFSDGDSDDVITDFGSGGSDLLRFEGYDVLFASASDVLATATQVGADVVFNLNGTDSVRLLNVALNTITVSDIEYIAPIETSGDDVINGTGGGDFFNGLGGNDVINGFGGNDTLFGGSGEDTIDGGDDHDDVRGDAGNDQLSGGAGNDSLRGFDGDDILSGGAGVDHIFGHAGNDTVDYRTSSAAVAINLQMDTQSGGDAQGDRLFTIENIIGSAFNDTLSGEAGANVIQGEAGNDTILGGAGDDTLIGGAGANRFDFSDGDGDDVITDFGSGGSDLLRFTGYDVLFASASDVLATATQVGADVVFNLNGTDSVRLLNVVLNTITVGDIEYIAPIITSGDDVINGTGGGDFFNGLGGNDVINGFGGNDTLFGGSGEDTIDGGDDNDDVRGDAGNDVISGGAGRDSLRGFDGDDILAGGAGVDLLIGHGGTDTADYRASSAAVTVDLQVVTQSGGDAQDDRLYAIENIFGSAFNDTLTGDAGANVIRGEAGNDFIRAGDGADLLLGGAGFDDLRGDAGNDFILGGADNDALRGFDGDDILAGGAGVDLLIGHSGVDTADYRTSSAAVTVNLQVVTQSGGDAQGDRLYTIEDIFGSALDDTLTGNADANLIRGLGGDDVILGEAGDDTFFFDLGGNTDTIGDFTAGMGTDDAVFLFGFGAAFDTFAEIFNAATESGGTTTIDFGAGDMLILSGVAKADLHQDDFLFG